MEEIKNKKIFLGSRFKYDPASGYKAPMSFKASETKRNIESKIGSGKYRYEHCDCYCGGDMSALLSERDRYGNYYPFVICKNCGIMRANPRFTEDSYLDFYKYEYRTMYGDGNVDKGKLYALRKQQGEETYGFINEHIKLPRGAVIFDVGCNMGTALLPFYENEYEVAGVDYDAEYIEFGRKMTGLPLEVGGAQRLKEYAKKSDLVILNHVLEHFIDLNKGLKDIHEILNSGGYAYISVPGIFWWVENMCGGDMLGLLQNAHTWQFSLGTLRYVMECGGFELAYGDEKIQSIFRKRDVRKRDLRDIPGGEFKKIYYWLKLIERRYFLKRLMAKALRRVKK